MIQISCDKCNKSIKDVTIYTIHPKTTILYNNYISEVQSIPPIFLCVNCYTKIKSWILNESGIN